MNFPEKMLGFVKGDHEAFDFLMNVHEIVEVWDDLIDKDKAVSDLALNDTFYRALIVLPRNGFYQRNFSLLNPIFEAGILDWFTANALEAKGDTESLMAARVLRCNLQQLMVMCARVVGGVEWAKRVGLELRTMGVETFAQYASELGVK